MLPAAGEIFFGVIDHLTGAEFSHHVHISGAAHAGHIGAERLGDLHGEGAHTSRRAVDKDLLPRLNFSSVAQTLQGGDRCDGHGSSLLKRQVRGFERHAIGGNTQVLGKGSGLCAEYLVA